MPRKHRFESGALQFLYDRYVGNDPARQAAYEAELANAELARAIYEMRTKAGVSQRELADILQRTGGVLLRSYRCRHAVPPRRDQEGQDSYRRGRVRRGQEVDSFPALHSILECYDQPMMNGIEQEYRSRID